MSAITGFTWELRKLRETSVVLANDRKHFKAPHVPVRIGSQERFSWILFPLGRLHR